tara:strand:+ start:3615 stop:4715 length:1101 start_codon:yes stop_codon:yes gene_type:complete
MKVPFLDLKASFNEIQHELEGAVLRSIRSGQYVGGHSLESFEGAFKDFVDSDYCIGVANGLDALVLSLKVLGVEHGDEVIVPSNTFIATWLAVTQCGAIPVPIEPNPDTYNIDVKLIEAKITDRTKVIIPVHLYGQPADLDEILKLAKSYNLYVVEDAAQAHGASYKGRKIGSHGDLVTWSFYPGKNLGALGDGGAITTNNEELAEKLRLVRNYGSQERYVHSVVGSNSRLDPVQAAVLSVKLKHLTDWNKRRIRIASIYNKEFKDLPIILPSVRTYNNAVWHLYCVRTKNRDEFREKLSLLGIQTLIHYPIPPHLQDAYRFLNLGKKSFPLAESFASELISLPIGPSLTQLQVAHVVEGVKSLFC